MKRKIGKTKDFKKGSPRNTTSKKFENPVSKKVEKSDKSLNCGLYKVKNKFVFDTSKSSAKPEDEHLYVVFTDKNNNVDRIVGTTHLYEKKKIEKIEKGQLKIFQFVGANYPSGVTDTYYQRDFNNKPFRLNTFKKSPYKIQPLHAIEIFNFSKNKRR